MTVEKLRREFMQFRKIAETLLIVATIIVGPLDLEEAQEDEL
jgi:hypothetical protein